MNQLVGPRPRLSLHSLLHLMTVSTSEKGDPSIIGSPKRLLSEPLYNDLQSLSDLCIKIRLHNCSPQAAVLSDAIRRHVVSPIRHRLFSAATTSYRIPSLNTPYDDRYTTHLILKLVTKCTSPNVMPLANLCDEIYAALEVHTHMPCAYETLRAIWTDMLSILRTHIERWLSHSVVHDNEKQFFIATEGVPFPITVSENLPCFIPYAISEMIVFTGNATKCTKLISKDITAGLAIDIDPTFEKLECNPLSAALLLESACSSWRRQAAEHLSQILPFSQIGTRVRHLRDFLLHGNAAFWRCVFDDMRVNPQLRLYEGMTDEARQDVEKALNSLLSTAASEVYAHGDHSVPLEAPFTLRITGDNDIIPQFALSFAESQVLAPRAHIYGDAFSITFGSRHTSCELRCAFAHLLNMERCAWVVRTDATGSTSGEGKARGRMAHKRRRNSGHLVKAMELRRRMMSFIEAIEWYLQCEVLEPKFDKLLKLINKNDQMGLLRGRPLFDVVTEMHNEMMDDVFEECFIADKMMNVRLNSIFGVCMSFCGYIRAMSVERLRKDELEFATAVSRTETDFSRNVQLFVQLLTLQKKRGYAKIGNLLLQVSYNGRL